MAALRTYAGLSAISIIAPDPPPRPPWSLRPLLSELSGQNEVRSCFDLNHQDECDSAS